MSRLLAALLIPSGLLLVLANLVALGIIPGGLVLRFADLPFHVLNMGLMVAVMVRAAQVERVIMVRLIAFSGILASLSSIGFRLSGLTESSADALIPQALQISSFLCLIGGMTASLRVRAGIWTPILRLADTANIGLGLGLLFWYFVLRADSSALYYGEIYGPFVEAAYPALDFLMILVLIDHVRLGDISDSRLLRSLLIIVGGFVVGDLFFNLAATFLSGSEAELYAVGDVLWGLALLGYVYFGLNLIRSPEMTSSRHRAVQRSWIRDYAGVVAVMAFVITAASELLASTEINEILWILMVSLIVATLVIRQIAGAAATKVWLEGQNDRLQEEVERRTADLAQKTLQAEAASRVKSEFLANISHELRTPLNSVIGNLALADSPEFPLAQRQQLDRASRSADSLLRVINDILEYVKLDIDDAVKRSDEFGVETIFGFLRGRLGSAALQKSVELRFEVATDVPPVIIGDRYRLSQLLVQLIDNGIKFTDQGSVTVAVRSIGDPSIAAKTRLEFTVRDTGSGISKEQLARMFGDFEQGDGSLTRKHGGAGLGLAIATRIVEFLGGRLWAESAPGQGSSFFFELEFGVAETASAEQGQADNPAARLSGARVLLVEDNLLNREIAVKILASAGIDVVNAEHGREALDILDRDADIDGVLMDIQMPVMDGYAATRAIRAQERFRDLPIIAVTANVMLANTADAMAVGMNDCVPKPLKPTLLFETMAKWIRPTRERPSISSASASESVSDAAETVLRIPGVDVEKALGQALNDIGFYRKMLRRFVESHGNFKTEFRDAQVSSDPAAALRCAHTLKGNAANIGATALQAVAGDLETACRNMSSVDTIEQTFKETLVQLALVLDGIEKVGTGASSVAAATPQGADGSIDEAELTTLIARTRALLEESDPAASELLAELVSKTQTMPQQAALQRAADAAERFEFEEALRELGGV